MADWREELSEMATRGLAPTLPSEFREVVLAALDEFADELGKHKRTIQIEPRVNEIGMSVRTSKGLEFEAVLAFRDCLVFSLFSNEAIISNFRFCPKSCPTREEVLHWLVVLFAAVWATKKG